MLGDPRVTPEPGPAPAGRRWSGARSPPPAARLRGAPSRAPGAAELRGAAVAVATARFAGRDFIWVEKMKILAA